jgi:hypothetical protein
MNTRLLVLPIILFCVASFLCAQEVKEIKPDIVKAFPMGSEKGQIQYQIGPIERIGPVAFETWGPRMFVVNGGRFKVLEFDQSWNLVKESQPAKTYRFGQDLSNFVRLFSNGVCALALTKEGMGGYFEPNLTKAALPKEAHAPADPRMIDENLLGIITMDLDEILLYKNHIKQVILSIGEVINDQDLVRNYMSKRMDKRYFLKSNPGLEKSLLDVNGESDEVITERYSTMSGDLNYPEKAAVFQTFLGEISKYLPPNELDSFLSKIKFQLKLERVTDYGFILGVLNDEYGRPTQLFIKIDLENKKVSMVRFLYPEYSKDNVTTFSEDGKFFFAMTTIGRQWCLLRFRLG